MVHFQFFDSAAGSAVRIGADKVPTDCRPFAGAASTPVFADTPQQPIPNHLARCFSKAEIANSIMIAQGMSAKVFASGSACWSSAACSPSITTV